MGALLAFLPLLVCPIVMGGMLWLMHPSNADHVPPTAADTLTAVMTDAQLSRCMEVEL